MGLGGGGGGRLVGRGVARGFDAESVCVGGGLCGFGLAFGVGRRCGFGLDALLTGFRCGARRTGFFLCGGTRTGFLFALEQVFTRLLTQWLAGACPFFLTVVHTRLVVVLHTGAGACAPVDHLRQVRSHGR